MYPQPVAPPRAPAQRRSAPKKTNWTPWLVAASLLAIGTFVMLVVVIVLVAVLYAPEERIASGVAVAGVSIGGQSPDSAIGALEQHNFAAQPVTLTDGDRVWTVTLAELGVAVDIPATVEAARGAPSGTQVQPHYTIDLNQTQNALVAMSEQINIAAVPGSPPQMGRMMDIPVMLSRLYENLGGELADGVFELTMIEVAPPEQDPVAQYTGATTTHIVELGQELGLIARMYGVAMDDIVALNGITNPDLLYVGQELTIPAAGLYTPSAAEAPAPPTTAGKSIVVSTQRQRIYAYENGQLVHSYLVSTGLPDTPTVLGDFKIYVKHTATNMRGPDYYLPNVPFTMYFYQGYGIHGTYWHNSFGRPMSHGCVNLPTPEAEWFFNWADVGTPVRVI